MAEKTTSSFWTKKRGASSRTIRFLVVTTSVSPSPTRRARAECPDLRLPGGEAFGHGDFHGGGAVLGGDQIGRPVGRIGEVGADGGFDACRTLAGGIDCIRDSLGLTNVAQRRTGPLAAAISDRSAKCDRRRPPPPRPASAGRGEILNASVPYTSESSRASAPRLFAILRRAYRQRRRGRPSRFRPALHELALAMSRLSSVLT